MTNKWRIRKDRRELYKVRDLSQGGGVFGSRSGKGIDSSFMPLVNQTKWKFIPSDEELIPLDHESVYLYVLSSYSIISSLCINRCLIKA